MEQKHIIIILAVVVVALVAVMAVMSMPSLNSQKDSKIAIVSNSTLYGGDNLTVKLTDMNKTPIKNEKVNVTVMDDNGDVVVKNSILTNSKGKASMQLNLDAGKYNISVEFGGNENYTATNITKKVTIKEEEAVQQTAQQTSSSAQQSSGNDNGLKNSREFEGSDYAPGLHVRENTYDNGDIEHYYSDGSYDYYDSSAQEWRYKNSDGSEGSMYVGN